MTPDDRPPNVERLDWRLTELEKKFDAAFAHIEQRFDRLGSQMATLTFVDVRLYSSEQAAQDRAITALAEAMATLKTDLSKRIDATDKRVVGAEQSNRSTLIYLVGIVLVALAGGLIRLAMG